MCLNKLSKLYRVSPSAPPSFQYAYLGLTLKPAKQRCVCTESFQILWDSTYAYGSICLFRHWNFGADLLRPILKIYKYEIHVKLSLVYAFMLMPFE